MQRKLEKQLALYGEVPPPEDAEPGENDMDDIHETDDEMGPHESTSGKFQIIKY